MANISASHTFLFVFPVYFDNNSVSFSFAFQIYLQGYPVSVGRVHITSGIDPYGRLDFEPGFLDE